MHAETTDATRLPKWLAPLGVGLAVMLGLVAKAKFLLLPIATMIASAWGYSAQLGWPLGVGFVGLILVHECGHIVAARWFGLRVSAPIFIPFMGAYVVLQSQPADARSKVWVSLAGPLAGAVSAAVCEGIFWTTGQPLFRVLAFVGCGGNLFNLAPVPRFDGFVIFTELVPGQRWLGAAIGFGALLLVSWRVVIVTLLLCALLAVLTGEVGRIAGRHRRTGRFWAEDTTVAEKKEPAMTAGQLLGLRLWYFGLVAGLAAGAYFTAARV